MAEHVLTGIKELTEYLDAKRFKHGVDGRLLAAIGGLVARLTKREMSGPIPKLSAYTVSMRRKRSNVPLKDTGALVRSIVWDRVQDGVEIGSVLKYARLQQEGGTITPKKAKKLALPATQEAKNASSTFGVRKAIEMLANKYGAVRFTPGTIQTGGVVQFYRRDSVTVPARPYLVWNADRETKVSDLVHRWLEMGVGK